MWVIGGTDLGETAEFVDINGKNSIMFEEQLPFWFEYHCATQINSTYSIITGDYWSNQKTLIVNLNDFDVTTGPILQKQRYGHSCARISAANGTDYVIVVGGKYYPKDSEIMVGNSWKDGMYTILVVIQEPCGPFFVLLTPLQFFPFVDSFTL